MKTLRIHGAALTLLAAGLSGCTSTDRDGQEAVPTKHSPTHVSQSALVGDWSELPKDIGYRHVKFTANSQWSGSLDGCNTQHGSWSLDVNDGRVTLDKLSTTLALCSNPVSSEPVIQPTHAQVAVEELRLLSNGVQLGSLSRVVG